jgi:hypothetical protein
MLCQDLQKRSATLVFAAGALALALYGCTPTQTSGRDGKAGLEGRVSRPDLTVPSPERAVAVSFLRDRGSIDAKCVHDILVNGRFAFSLSNGESQTIYLSPGQYSFGMQSGGRGCPNVAISQSTALGVAGETYRISSPNGYGAQLVRIK